MPTYSIVTLGCKLNQAESAALEARLRGLGLQRAPAGAGGTAADVVVLNTCTVTGFADREARQIARRLRRAHPRATLIATGCYAERDPEALRAGLGIDHVVGLRDQLERVPALAAGALRIRYDPQARSLGDFGATEGCDPHPDAADRTRAWLKIQDGCDLRCSYCVIPSVRGASRSVPPAVVLARLARLIDGGFREIVLTGVNTGAWGQDLDPRRRLEDLLREALAAAGPARLRLNSLEPGTVTPGIAALLAFSERLAPHLQIPLQSGCDAVLARMRRPYRRRHYARLVEGLRRAVPDMALGADVIVGFPGETEAEFLETRDFIAASPLNYLHVFSYSPRPGTPAAALPGGVPPAAIRERSARLRELAGELSLRFRRSFVGRARRTLALRQVRRDGRLRGLTDNFIEVGIDPGDRDPDALMNRLLPIRITGADRDGAIGVIAADAAAPGAPAVSPDAPGSPDACRSGAA
jgi:threonylcarbamoyladenosine tRNA methylthiotransferase MtaB